MNAMTRVEAAKAVSASAIGLPEYPRCSRSWPEARVDEMCALLAQGRSFAEVAGSLGVTRSAVSGQVDRMRTRRDPRLSWSVSATAETRQRRRIERPADFAEQARGTGNAELCQRYGVCDRLISRWRRETDTVAFTAGAAAPVKFATLAPTMSLYEAKLFFGCGDLVLKRWAAETGVRFRVPSQVASRGNRAKTVRETQRDMSLVGQAAEYLQRFSPVYRCDKIGRADPEGKLWRRGSAVLTDEEIVERAEWNGWDANAWRKVAA